MSRRDVCRGLRSACFFVGLALAPEALAAELTVRGPEGCPDAAELAFRVERALGAPITDSGPLRFGVLFVAEQHSGPGYAAQLRLQRDGASSGGTERVLRARDCGRLGDAVSVAIALAIGAELPAPAPKPEAPASPGPAQVSSVAAPEQAHVPVVADEQLSSSTGDRSGPWLPVVQAFLLADGGSLAERGLGMGIGTELRGARLALRARGMVLFEQRAGAGDAAPGAQLRLMLGSLSGCVAPFSTLHSTFSPFVCGGWELGRLDGKGDGIAAPLSGHQLWTAPHADAGLTGSILGGALRLALQVSVAAPLNRDDFCLRDIGCVYRPPGAVGRLSLGAELGFE